VGGWPPLIPEKTPLWPILVGFATSAPSRCCCGMNGGLFLLSLFWCLISRFYLAPGPSTSIRHFERSEPTFSSRFAPAKRPVCEKRNLSSTFVGPSGRWGGKGTARIEENTVQSHLRPTQSGKRMSQGLHGVRQAAKERKQERFTALLHHLSVGLLRDSFYALQGKASLGIGGVTWQEYGTGLEDRLVDLHRRVHRGAYRAKPSRRVYIPKADGRQRPLSIAALEDKVVQQAVV
jgi:hypothetical protein